MEPEFPLAGELAAVFAGTSGLLLSAEAVHTALRLITSVAVETFPNNAGAGVTLLDPDGVLITAAATDAQVERADALQYERGRGPCMTAWEEHRVVHVPDVTRDERWPEWSGAVGATGVRAVLSAPLVAGARSLGAIKVYAHEAEVFGAREEHLLTMYAAQAATLLLHLRTAEDARRISDDLKHALRARDVVSLAKGVLMARHGVSERTAFLMLADSARDKGATIGQTAERLIAPRPGG
ncbi:GAF and ANTAR domain-containing protein [Actinokineospora soli]|uniref:GAF and ANTAR domain-containing protein n=1 Tax=Actinokineospora soli TaxID=1048753 RepID=A0ABW2TTA6_9PSEU